MAEHIAEAETLLAQLERAPRDAAHVEQVVEQACHVDHLALDHVVALVPRCLVDIRSLQHLDGVADRRQGIP